MLPHKLTHQKQAIQAYIIVILGNFRCYDPSNDAKVEQLQQIDCYFKR